jgi:hypothetical protein
MRDKVAVMAGRTKLRAWPGRLATVIPLESDRVRGTPSPCEAPKSNTNRFDKAARLLVLIPAAFILQIFEQEHIESEPPRTHYVLKRNQALATAVWILNRTQLDVRCLGCNGS